MSDVITGMFVTGSSLKITKGSRIFEVQSNSGEPNTWKVEHFANIGTSEDFVHLFSGELMELVDASHIYGAERDAVKEALLTVMMEGLMPAFESLKRIRASVGQQLPKLNRAQLFEDFSRVLWHGYKDLMPRAALLLGFDIGFLFQNDATFAKGIASFNIKHPALIAPNLGDHLKRQRDTWQNEFGHFRNDYLEHRRYGQTKFAKFYDPAYAETLFTLVWTAMANLFPVFIEANFVSGISIEEIPVSERDPLDRKRYRYFQYAPIELREIPALTRPIKST